MLQVAVNLWTHQLLNQTTPITSIELVWSDFGTPVSNQFRFGWLSIRSTNDLGWLGLISVYQFESHQFLPNFQPIFILWFQSLNAPIFESGRFQLNCFSLILVYQFEPHENPQFLAYQF